MLQPPSTSRASNPTEGERLQLTAAQRGIWYAQQLDPENPTYQIGQFLELPGPIDAELMSLALTKVAGDLDAISSRFAEDADGPYAVIRRPRPGARLLRVVDLTSVEPDEARARARAQMDAEMETPRDLTGDQLFGATLFRMPDGGSQFFQRVHHIMLDGYSAVIALKYLAEVYSRLEKITLGGRFAGVLRTPLAHIVARIPSPLPALPELLDTLEAYRASEQYGRDEAYWREALAEEATVTGLEGAPSSVARRVERVTVNLSAERAEQLSSLGRELPKTIVALTALYLSRITGEERVSLGLPVTARRGKVAKRTPSMLSSILPMRIDIDPSHTVSETVQRAGDVVRGAVQHQRFRVEEIDGAPAYAGPSINLLPVIDDLRFGDTPGTVNILSTGPVHDLSVVLSGLESGAADARLQLEGDAALHSAETLHEHAQRLLALIDAALVRDDARVADLPMVSASESEALLDRGVGEIAPIPTRTVLDALAEHVASTPRQTAVVAEDRSLTFAELDGEANRLARYLIEQGVGPGSAVAVRVDRTSALPVAVLAVLRAGGVYVPLDPAYPVDRVAAMIEDSSPAVILTETPQAERDRADGASWDVPSVDLDTDTAAWRRQSARALAGGTAGDDDLAYIVFTSGSTGRPKGVGVDRLALRNLFQQHSASLFTPARERLGRPLRVAHTTGLSFDAAWDPLLWLCAGHELHLIDEATRRDPERLVTALADAEIDAIETTPAFAEALIGAGLFAAKRYPTEIALGGEAVGPDLWDALAERADVRAVNLYGPTETTVDSMVAEIEPGSAPHLGGSVMNSRHYVLDSGLQPVPDRANGELYLAGANVARGYVGQPGLSAERFIADPFASDGSRMYRTGDVVQRRDDGSLRFVGRLDDQVKIRGYRVEIDEVESALRAQDGVAAAAALVLGSGAAARIVGYVTAGDGADPSDHALTSAVREGMRRSVPDYMVPASVLLLDEFPMTPNGKLDRRALPAPDAGVVASQQPRTDAERLVAEAIAEVLEIEQVGIDEDFFAAGGHSLLATRLAALLSERLERSVAVRDVFERPTAAALAELAQSAGEQRSRVSVAVRPDPLPVSLTQRRLWFLNRLEPDSSAYNIPLVLDVDGPLDVRALQRAVDDVVARHEPLRTRFPMEQGEPIQQVIDADDARVPFLAIDAGNADVDTVVAHEATRPFDIARELPLRALVLRVADDRHVLVLTLHHIAADGWSLAPFARDLSLAYTAQLDGTAPEFPELPVSYADFAVWQRDRLGDAADPDSEIRQQLAYWTRALAGAPAEITLPRDFDRASATDAGAGECTFDVPADQHAVLRDTAQGHQASLFMVLHAALALTLEHVGAGEDIVIGTPVAGRDDPHLEDLVGFFVNTIALRVSLSGDPTLAELLERVRSGNTEAYGHQEVPFDTVVDAIKPPRSAGRHPVFQVMLTLQNTAPAELRLGEASVSVPGQMTSAGVKADLLFDAATPDGDDGPLRIGIGYDRSLFTAETVERIRDAFSRALAAVTSDGDRSISRVALGTSDAIADVADTDRGRELVAADSVLDRLQQTAARIPDAPALSAGSDRWTFRELDAEITRLAAGMATLGIRAGDRVGVAMPRGRDAIALVLAALRAGAIAVPIDVQYPDLRIAQMWEDADLSLLMTADPDRMRGIADGAEQTMPHTTVSAPDELRRAHADAEGTPPIAHVAQLDEAAYLVYTSGTTGRPKGVQVSHGALANVLAQHEDALIGPTRERIGGEPRMLHLSGLGFDAAWDPMLWLVSGSELVMADDALRVDAERVVQTIRERGIDVIETTPSYAAQLASVGLLDDARDRETPLTLALGGEAVSADLWNRIAENPGVDGWNLYGPSESTVDAVVAPIAEGRVVIGAPIANVSARVLDRFLRPVPTGTEGELYLSGPSLADGYRGRAVETATRFVADPTEPGARMYRTGDVVRRGRDGALEFLRRNDDQIKLRGFRIELGDVERTLERVAGVRQAVARVVTPGGQDANAQLVAWVAPESSVEDLDPESVRRETADRLPEYQVPTRITSVAEFPMTPNGKIDIDRLPEPLATTTDRKPSTPVEQSVADAFGAVLGVDGVGMDDDFFQLGGHSLLAVSLAGELRDRLGAELPLRALFEATTPARVVSAIGSDATGVGSGSGDAGDAPSVMALSEWTSAHPRDAGADAPLSPGQARLHFLNRLDPTSPEYSVVLQAGLTGELDVEALEAAIDDVVARHEVLRTVYPEVDGEPVQRVLPAPQGLLRHEPVDTRQGFDLATELPIRAGLAVLAANEWRLDLVIHHIATDGASLAPLTRDLATAYAARTAGAPALQRPLPVQVSDFARMQRAQEGDAATDAGLASWIERLEGAPDELDLPADGRRSDSVSRQAIQVPFTVPADVAGALGDAAGTAGGTAFHGWLGALAGYLHRVGAGDDIVIGSPSAGRSDPDLSDLVGFFVNTLPLRIGLADDPTLHQTIRRARESTLHAIEHESVPFERIVESMSPERRLGRHPLFQTMLTVEEVSGAALDLPGVEVQAIEPESTGAAKVDLSFTLRLRETGEVSGVLEADAELFSEASAHGLVERWIEFVRAAGAQPSSALRTLPFADGASRIDGADPGAIVPEPLFDVFARTISAAPAAPLISDGTMHLSAEQLDDRVSALAAGLAARGVQSGDAVAIHLPRSVDTAAAMLAVWRAGGVGVPVDTELPVERVRKMLRATAAVVRISAESDASLGDSPNGVTDTPVVTVDALIAAAGDDRVVRAVEPHHPAYVIFTSGSTGEPKGVQVPHRALDALLASHRSTVMAGADGARVAHTTGVGFDAAIDPLLWLVSGHELVVLDDDTRRNPRALVDALDELEIDVWETTPSYVAALVEQSRLGDWWDARSPERPFTMLLGGEPVDQGLWTWLRARPAVNAWNLYGPTEVGVDTLVAPVDRSPSPDLGVTTTETRAYVLDDRLQPVPVGSVGELWLAGNQLADGYLGNAVSTADHFVADPFTADGNRMYRTGDLVVVRDRDEHGRARVESLGRSDGQVKIRGHRVEPGEIESVLRAASGVVDAVVRPVSGPGGDVLAAWVVPADTETDFDALVARARATLRERLADYMVPREVVRIDEVPRTPNGKVDVRALPEVRVTGSAGRAPETAAERAVAAAFAEVLGVSEVGAEDSFFALGGHSFIAQPLIDAVNRSVDARVTVQSLFRAPTVEGLAALATSADSAGADDPDESLARVLPLRAGDGSAPLFMVHPATGLAWKFAGLAAQLPTERPVFGLQMPGIAPDETELPLARDTDELLDAYLAGMREIQPTGPYHLIGYSLGGRIAHLLAGRLQAAGERVELLVSIDAYPGETEHGAHGALTGLETDDEMWRAFLDANGIAAPASGAEAGAFDPEAALAYLREAGSPLGDIPVASVRQMVTRFRHLGARLDEAALPVYSGDILLFEATEEVPADRPDPEAWHRYVDGNVEVVPVPARHQDMLDQHALVELVPALETALARLESPM